MQFIAARLCGDIYDRTAGKTELRVVFAGVHLNFLHPFNRRRDADVGVLRLAVRNTFDINGVRIRVHAADRSELRARLADG